MLDHLQTIKEENHNTIKIAMLPIFSHYDLAHKLNDFSKNHPHIHLIIDEVEERDLHHKLDYHDYDIYILRGDYEELHAFQQILLYEDSLVAAISKQHPFSHLQQLSINQLKDEKLLLPLNTQLFVILLSRHVSKLDSIPLFIDMVELKQF